MKMPENQIILACPVCQATLTRPVAPMLAGEAICLADGKPAVPEGFFAIGNDDYWTASDGCLLVNLADLTDTQYHPEPRRNSGCCGRSGSDGPNLLCPNGHEIGTELSDCWMAHAAVFLPSVIRQPVR
jgi:hypothetical protein